MKTKILIVLLISLISFSCQKYLDIKTESRQSFIETSQDCQLVLDNYGVMNLNYAFDGEASADDYYLDPLKYNSDNIKQDDRSIYTWGNTFVRSDPTQWRSLYFIIYNSNLILESLDKLKDNPSPDTRNLLKGSALFFRAYALWNVAQLYCNSYNEASAQKDLGIPVKLNSDINDVSTRGTVQQTYNRIVEDLIESSTLLPNTSTVPSRPSKVASLAMLARVYLSMEKYPQAKTSANDALTIKHDLIDYNSLDTTSSTPFNPRFNKEVIFHSVTSMTYLLFPADYDNYARIDTNLISTYAPYDLRKNVFFNQLESGTNKYYFTGNYEPSNNGTYFNGLAVDELYLIRAECYAREGNVSQALVDLNTLLRTRWTTNSFIDYVSSNSDEALNLIINERRKELIMRGQRWTDLRRLNKDPRFAKVLVREINNSHYTLPPNDLRYTLLIPLDVIQNSKLEQNFR